MKLWLYVGKRDSNWIKCIINLLEFIVFHFAIAIVMKYSRYLAVVTLYCLLTMHTYLKLENNWFYSRPSNRFRENCDQSFNVFGLANLLFLFSCSWCFSKIIKKKNSWSACKHDLENGIFTVSLHFHLTFMTLVNIQLNMSLTLL